MAYHKPFMNMTMEHAPGDRKVPHFLTHPFCLFMLPKEAEVTINNCINIQAIARHPLFITPIAGWLLSNQVAV